MTGGGRKRQSTRADGAGSPARWSEVTNTEEALRDARTRLEAALAGAQIGTWTWDLTGRRIIGDANVAKLFGISEAEAADSTVETYLERMHPDDRPSVEAALNRVLAGGGVYDVEYRVVLPDGPTRWVAARGEVPLDESGRPMSLNGVVQDITARRLAEQMLLTNQADLNRAQAVGQIGSWRMDVQKNELLWSPENHRIFGIPEGTPMTYETFLGTIHPEDREFVDQKWMAALRGEHYDVEHRILVDGAVKWVRERAELEFSKRGQLLGGFGTTQDITERKRAQEDLEKSLRRFELLAETAAELLRASPQRAVESLCLRVMEHLDCQVFLDHLVDEKTGRLLLNACAGISSDQAAAIRRLGHPVAGCRCIPREGRCAIADGSVAPADECAALVRSFGIRAYACHPIIGPGNAVVGTLSFGTRGRDAFSDDDLSLMKAVADQVAAAMVRMRGEQALRDGEARLKELNESLERRVAERTVEVREQADLLRALATELSEVEQRERKRLAQVLHDHIQQLLVAARFQLELAARNGADADGRSQAWRDVNAILKEAIDASRTLAVELSPPVLHEAGLIGALQWLASRLAEQQQLAVRLRCDAEAEPVDEQTRLLLFECVRELLLNVTKHSGVSEVEVTLSRGGDGRVTLTVEDAGKGFDLESLRNRRTEATLGLFSIQQRLAHLGGRVEISSAPGHGTRVTLVAPTPRATPASGAGEPKRRAAGRAAGKADRGHKKTRVLIVDDHTIVREGLVRLLQMEGDFDIVGEAADGPEAIGKAASLEPDIVVMDVGLGSMSGIDATRAILAAGPGIRVIGLSMHIDREMVNAMTEAGAVAYFTKGGPPEDLINAIRAFARQ